MLVRDMRRLALYAGPLLVLLYIGLSFFHDSGALPDPVNDWFDNSWASAAVSGETDRGLPQDNQAPIPDAIKTYADNVFPSTPEETPRPPPVLPQFPKVESLHDPSKDDDEDTTGASGSGAGADGDEIDVSSTHTVLYSQSTKNKKFFYVKFGTLEALNANIIPHPSLQDTWIVVAQLQRSTDIENSIWFAELSCNAAFKDGALQCISHPMTVPIAATIGDKCEGEMAYFNFNVGPHDARVFYGPEHPYAIYGSNGAHACFGIWIQDFRMLVDWGFQLSWGDFRLGTELQRPPPWGKIEKNWFLFWDPDGNTFVHYDTGSNRVFASLLPGGNGSVGADLAPKSADHDDKCLARYLPKLPPSLESIHQATNSLSITTCRRDDPSCVPDDDNTFIITIVQHKTYYNFHPVYEPYVMAFRRRAPFALHGISRRPFWIHGRQQHPEFGTSDMFYVVSMSWKNAGQTYHGHVDDPLFVAFGIEDKQTAGIDIRAGDLLEGLGLCSEGS